MEGPQKTMRSTYMAVGVSSTWRTRHRVPSKPKPNKRSGDFDQLRLKGKIAWSCAHYCPSGPFLHWLCGSPSQVTVPSICEPLPP